MNTQVLGLFDSTSKIDELLSELSLEGFSSNEVSIITQERVVNHGENTENMDFPNQEVREGAKTGGLVGGIIGLLAGVGILTIPGLGALLIAGPITAALGLTGAVGTTASGAITGALAGGLIGALRNLGVEEEVAQRYEERVKSGDILIGVDTTEDEVDDVKELMRKHGATDITTISNE